MTASQSEWRVAYTAPHHVGEMAPGTHYHPCRDREHALDVYAYHMTRSTVVDVHIERRPFAEWQRFDIEAEAEAH
jgi:hypothetical protein